MAAPPPPPPAALPGDVVEEILLLIPPEDPGCLLRASLVCKAWRSAATHPHFRRRFIGLHRHRAPPVLGFLHDWEDERIPDFVPTTASPFSLAAPDRRLWRPLDCRHGRALFLSDDRQETQELLLWEPITGSRQRIPVPSAFRREWPTAAVFCAADGCDHRDCAGGPFGVVFVFAVDISWDSDSVTSACLYSSETGTWGKLSSRQDEFVMDFEYHSSVLVGRSLLYFMSDGGMILEYNLDSGELAVLGPPPDDTAVTTEDLASCWRRTVGWGLPKPLIWSSYCGKGRRVTALMHDGCWTGSFTWAVAVQAHLLQRWALRREQMLFS